MRATRLALMVVLLSLVASCAGPNVSASADGAGFWRGVLHGSIAPVTLVISWFREDVSPYEVKNNGGCYDSGFLIGIGMWGGGGAAASRRRRSRDRQSGKVKAPSPG